MNLEFKYPNIDYSVESIMMFEDGENSDYWSEPLFYFYENIDKEYFRQCTSMEKKLYLTNFFKAFEVENKKVIDEKVITYHKRWLEYKTQIIDALEDAFQLDTSALFEDMIANITFNPISPRFLDTNTFDIFYLNSDSGALGLSIHEIIHFVWFYVWNQEFKDDYREYETPSLKWILSEMVVEPIMRDERLSSINPYFEHKECVYDYFYTLYIKDQLILDILYEMYSSMNIIEFMKKSYQFCQEHEDVIRSHMLESETHS